MKILKGAITRHASRGQTYLIVDELPRVSGEYEYEEVPDDWIRRVSSRRLYLGAGFERPWHCSRLCLTPKGWEANKDKIKEVFENSDNPKKKTWEEFEEYAEFTFNEIITETKKFIEEQERGISMMKDQLELYVEGRK